MTNPISTRSLAVAAWNRLVRTYQKIDRLSELNFRSLGLNTAWFDVLARVGAHEGVTQNQLAASLLVTKGNISQLLTKLAAEELIERRAEGRSQQIFLTDRGRTLAGQAIPRQERLLAESFQGLSPRELTELARILRKLEKL